MAVLGAILLDVSLHKHWEMLPWMSIFDEFYLKKIPQQCALLWYLKSLASHEIHFHAY